jgi:hypothetical protein
MSKPKPTDEPAGPPEMPADWKCDLDAPRSRLLADTIAFIERKGGPEPSAVKKNLMAYRRIAWESHQAGSGPNLLRQLQRADARVESLARETAPCPSCRRGPGADKIQALRAARQERGRVADALAARHALHDRLRGEREAAMAKLQQSVTQALSGLVARLGVPALLNCDRALYLAAPDEIPGEVVRRFGIAERAGELGRRMDSLSGVGSGQIFAELDKEMAVVLQRRLDMVRVPVAV